MCCRKIKWRRKLFTDYWIRQICGIEWNAQWHIKCIRQQIKKLDGEPDDRIMNESKIRVFFYNCHTHFFLMTHPVTFNGYQANESESILSASHRNLKIIVQKLNGLRKKKRCSFTGWISEITTTHADNQM